jgi:hypothetical protein
VRKPKGKNHLEDLGVDGKKMDLHQVECGEMDWIELDQDKDRWRALGECVKEASGSINCGEFLD